MAFYSSLAPYLFQRLIIGEKGKLLPNDDTVMKPQKQIDRPPTANQQHEVKLAEHVAEVKDSPQPDWIRHHVHRGVSAKHTKIGDWTGNPNEHEVEVLVPNATSFCAQQPPTGISRMAICDPNKVKISYDANVVGIRQIVEHMFACKVDLAASPFDMGQRLSITELRRQACVMSLLVLLTLAIFIIALTFSSSSRTCRSLSLALATIVQSLTLWQTYSRKGWIFDHRRHGWSTRTLVTLSTTATYAFSVVIYAFDMIEKPIRDGDFFASSALTVAVAFAAQFVKSLAKHASETLLSMRSLQPRTVNLYIDEYHQSTREIDIRLLEYNDVIQVRPRSRVATDGIVVCGGTEVDESRLTGRTKPVAKGIGSKVIAGSLNLSGSLDVLVTRLADENTISTTAQIIDGRTMDDSRSSTRASVIADSYVTAVMLLAVLVFASQLINLHIGQNLKSGFAIVESVTLAITVLLVSCPCAILLIVPLLLDLAHIASFKHRAVFKEARALELARSVTHVVFDKTASLIEDVMHVRHEKFFLTKQLMPNQVSAILITVLANVHDRAFSAVYDHLQAKHQSEHRYFCEEVQTIPGRGIEATYKDQRVRFGNAEWLGVSNLPSVRAVKEAQPELTVVCMTYDARIVAVFGLADQLRADAVLTVRALQARGFSVSLVSSDGHATAHALSRQLGITTENVRAECSGRDKAGYVLRTRAADPKAVVLFCGDGRSDADVIEVADVGVHIANSGSSVRMVRESSTFAGVVLLRSRLSDLLVAVGMSRAVFVRLVACIAWCVVYHLFALTFVAALCAGVELRLPLEYAALGQLVCIVPIMSMIWSLSWWPMHGKLWKRQVGLW